MVSLFLQLIRPLLTLSMIPFQPLHISQKFRVPLLQSFELQKRRFHAVKEAGQVSSCFLDLALCIDTVPKAV